MRIERIMWEGDNYVDKNLKELSDFLVERKRYDEKVLATCENSIQELLTKKAKYGEGPLGVAFVGDSRRQLDEQYREQARVTGDLELVKYILKEYFPDVKSDIEPQVTEEQFKSYLRVQKSGKSNMYMADVPLCSQSDMAYIMNHYAELVNLWGDK